MTAERHSEGGLIPARVSRICQQERLSATEHSRVALALHVQWHFDMQQWVLLASGHCTAVVHAQSSVPA